MRAANISVQELLEGSKVYAIPLFQRPYTWGRTQWKALWANILEQYEFAVDSTADAAPVNHFIGSFVFAPAPAPGSQPPPRRILVVDGQQRLITLSLLLAAIRDLRWESADPGPERTWLENDFGIAYLTNSVLHPTIETSHRVLPTQDDRAPFFAAISKTPGLSVGRPGEAFNYFKREARRGDSNGNPLDLEMLTTVMLTRLTLIEITTEPGDNVHRVFQTLNSSGVLLRQIDLLRNHFFMLLPTLGEELYREVWRDMELRLGEAALDRFMWASLVPFDQRVSRKSVFATMQRRLEIGGSWPPEADVEVLLRSLNRDSQEYLKLVQPDEEDREQIRTRLECLAAWGTDTYHPLGLALLKLSRDGHIDDGQLEQSLLLIESFLVRRMLCGIPTNQLNRIFSRITAGLPQTRTEGWLFDALQRIGSPWPSGTVVKAAVRDRPFLFSGQPAQRRFVLTRLEGSLGDEDFPTLGPVEVQAIVADPDDIDLTLEAFERVGHNLGNVTLVERGLVSGSASFDDKRDALSGSRLLLNSDIGEAVEWDERQIAKRSRALAERVVAIWPGPESGSADGAAPIALADVIALLPDDGFTTVSELAELRSNDERTILSDLAMLPPDQRRRVIDGGSEGADHLDEGLAKRFDALGLSKLLEEEDASNLEESDL